MSRIKQKVGIKGSQKWLQICVQFYPELLQPANYPKLTWLSPLADDDYAEYQDGSFLNLLGVKHLKSQLKEFWPHKGPVWDGLALAKDTVFLIEAKAHLNEFFTPATSASNKSRAVINNSLTKVSNELGANPKASWSEAFYQYSNRLAHLWFLRSNGINAKMVFVSFVGDNEMQGPESELEWAAIFKAADYVLGLPKKHKLSKHIIHVYPNVHSL